MMLFVTLGKFYSLGERFGVEKVIRWLAYFLLCEFMYLRRRQIKIKYSFEETNIKP